MNININSIMGKVRRFSKTAEGKGRMSDYLRQRVSDGHTATQSGTEIVSLDAMEQAAVKLAQSIIATAASYDLPDSVMRNINSLTCTKPYQVADGTYRIDLYFTDDLSRDSLYEEKYDGVVNIIALFNNGYLAQDNVYGFWDGHTHAGENNILRQSVGDIFTYVRSKIGRPALLFMQEAVDDFNNNYGAVYNATALLDGIYEEIPTVAKVI